MIVLAFDLEASAVFAVKKIWVNMIRNAVEEGKIVRNGGHIYTDLSGLSEDFIATLKVCGERKEELSWVDGWTVRFYWIQKAYQIEKWWVAKPDDKFLIDVVGYTEQELPPEWIKPTP